jgi:ribonucleotide monophosphatase NagD (HAD superfamily)
MKGFDFPPEFALEVNNLAIDFDGVIHNSDKGFHDGTCYGDPLPGALEALAQLSEKYRIIIFTAKAKPNRPLVNGKSGTELVSDWLASHGALQFVSEITSEKPRAILYIDDNAYRFENWKETLEYLERM